MITAAALCPAPPLLARELTGAGLVLPELRQACAEAVSALVSSAPDLVAVVGAGELTARHDPRGELDLGAYAPAFRSHGHGEANGSTAPRLPLPLGLGGRLLDEAGYRGRRELWTVGAAEPAGACAALGTRLAGLAGRTGLLVMADGTARRTLRAPGWLDERAAPFDAEVERALREPDLPALLTLDEALARDLMAAGRPAWQVLAGAFGAARPASAVRYCDAPLGVAYLVASLVAS